jgi:hypothetical protein
MLKEIYGEFTMKMSNVLKWSKHFWEGREHVNDNERQGAPVTKWTNKNVAKIGELVWSDYS